MAPQADKGGNLGKATKAMTSLGSQLKQVQTATGKLKAKMTTLPKGAQANVKKLTAIDAAIEAASRIKTAMKGLQNKKKKGA